MMCHARSRDPFDLPLAINWYVEEILDLPGYSGTAEEEIRCSVFYIEQRMRRSPLKLALALSTLPSSLAEALGIFRSLPTARPSFVRGDYWGAQQHPTQQTPTGQIRNSTAVSDSDLESTISATSDPGSTQGPPQ